MKRLLVGLVGLFPAAFRDRFGQEMREQVERDYERAWSRSRLHGMLFVVGTAADLLRSGLAEHMQRGEGGGMVRTLIRDSRQAARSLRRAPAFTVTTLGTLGLALGALAAVYSVVDSVLLEPLPYADPDRLVSISATAPGSELRGEFGVSLEFILQYRETALLEAVAPYDAFTATFRVADRAERIRMAVTTADFFQMMGVPPVLGRLPGDDDGRDALVLSHALWTEWFGGDPDVLGRTFSIFGPPRTVVGVMGPEFDLPDLAIPGERVLLWLPTVVAAEDVSPGDFGHDVVGRMTEEADPASLAAELDRLAARLPERFGGSPAYARIIERHRAVVRPLRDELLGTASRSIWILFAAGAVVLLIACANTTNLLLARAERRRRDSAVRRAMGAGRPALVRTQLAEVILLSVGAGVVAIGLAWVGLPALVALAPDVHRLADVAVTPSTLAFTLLTAMACAVLCGCVPAMRSASVGLEGLGDGSRTATGVAGRGRDILVVAQTTLALVLVAASGLLLRSFDSLRSVDPGYDVEDVYTFQAAPELEHLVDGPSWVAFHHDLLERIRALPGVESVGLVENVPLNEGVGDGWFLDEEAAARGEDGVLLGFTAAGGDYFGTMGIEVVRGRTFRAADHVSDLGHVVVSRSAADLLWPTEDPIGKRLQWRGLDTWETVVGVVEDVMQAGFRDDPLPLVYLPMTGQQPDLWALSSPAYVVKTERADRIGPEIRDLVRQVAPGAPVYRTFTMEELAADSMRQLTFTTLMVGITAALAFLLGVVGLYGVLSYLVAQRTREIGVRMALGAEASAVRRMIVARGVRVVTVGVALGLLVGIACSRFLEALLFGVEPGDPATFAVVATLMLAVGVLASYVPARRASGVDPVESLRTG